MSSDKDQILKFMFEKLGADGGKVMEEYRAHRIKALAEANATLDQLLEVSSDEEWSDELHDMTLRDIVAAVTAATEKPTRKKKTPRLLKRDPAGAKRDKPYRTDILAFLERQKRPVSVNAILTGVRGRSVGIRVALSHLVKEGWVKKDHALRGKDSVYSKAVNPGFKLETQTREIPIVTQVKRQVEELILKMGGRPRSMTLREIHRECSSLPLSKKQISRAVRSLVDGGTLRRQSYGVYNSAGHTHMTP